jgi:trimeric autotransporter adhesin
VKFKIYILFLAVFTLAIMPLCAQLPIIINQPAGRALWTGGNVTFAVGVSNSSAFTYQWQFNGTNLPDGIITTVAGGNVKDGIPATNATLNLPDCAVFDLSGNLYIADSDHDRIRKVDTHGLITTVAGNGASGSFGYGGVATNAALTFPTGVAVDPQGNVFIADNGNNFVLKVDTNGIITIVAGKGGWWSNLGDGGPATNAGLALPTGVALDSSGDLFIADQANNRVREVLTNGIIVTVAGTTPYENPGSYSGDGGPATNATLNRPTAVALDNAGNLFIADYLNSRVRKVDTNGIITTFAGGGTNVPIIGCAATNASLNYCSGVAADTSGNIFIADSGSNLVLKMNPAGMITAVLGDGAAGYAGDGTSSANAVFNGPFGVAVDSSGDIAISDVYNDRVREVNSRGIINTVAGSSAAYDSDGGPAADAGFFFPFDVAMDPCGRLFVADCFNNAIREVNTNGIITTVAGIPTLNLIGGYSGDGGPATNAALNAPQAIAFDASGNLFIADNENNVIRKVDTNGIITTFAGSLVTNSYGGNGGYFGDDGPATNAALQGPEGIAFDTSGNLFIADSGNQVIRKVDTNGIITTVAGSFPTNGVGSYSGDGGAATNANLNVPFGVAVDACGNIFIADTANGVVRKVDTNGIITTVAGNSIAGYSGDGGPATNASLYSPCGLLVDVSGDLLIADFSDGCIRKVDTNGIITTVVGNGIEGYSGDGGAAANATLNNPHGLALDPYGNLFIADMANNRIRKIINTQGPTLALNEMGLSGSGTYQLVASGPGGSVTNSVNLLVANWPIIYQTFLNPDHSISLNFVSQPGSTNVVFSATNLSPPIIWQPVSTNMAGGDGNWQFNDMGTAGLPAKFYRSVTR